MPLRLPSSRMPRIGGTTRPSAAKPAPPNRPWLLSTRPIPATSDQGIRQLARSAAIRPCAFRYAWYARVGMPELVRVVTEVMPNGAAAPNEPASGAAADGGTAATVPVRLGTSPVCGSVSSPPRPSTGRSAVEDHPPWLPPC